MRKSLRTGKVFVDWSQNDEHKTTVGVYSLRAGRGRPSRRRSRWDEVEAVRASRDPDDLVFTSDDVLDARRRAGRPVRAGRDLEQALPAL